MHSPHKSCVSIYPVAIFYFNLHWIPSWEQGPNELTIWLLQYSLISTTPSGFLPGCHSIYSAFLPSQPSPSPLSLPSPGPAVTSLALRLLLHTPSFQWPGLSTCQSGLPTATITIPPPPLADISWHTGGQRAEAAHSLLSIAPFLHLTLSPPFCLSSSLFYSSIFAPQYVAASKFCALLFYHFSH